MAVSVQPFIGLPSKTQSRATTFSSPARISNFGAERQHAVQQLPRGVLLEAHHAAVLGEVEHAVDLVAELRRASAGRGGALAGAAADLDGAPRRSGGAAAQDRGRERRITDRLRDEPLRAHGQSSALADRRGCQCNCRSSSRQTDGGEHAAMLRPSRLARRTNRTASCRVVN